MSDLAAKLFQKFMSKADIYLKLYDDENISNTPLQSDQNSIITEPFNLPLFTSQSRRYDSLEESSSNDSPNIMMIPVSEQSVLNIEGNDDLRTTLDRNSYYISPKSKKAVTPSHITSESKQQTADSIYEHIPTTSTLLNPIKDSPKNVQKSREPTNTPNVTTNTKKNDIHVPTIPHDTPPKISIKLDVDLQAILDKAMTDKLYMENIVAEAESMAIKATMPKSINLESSINDETNQYHVGDTLMYSSTFPDDHTSISSVTISAPISTYQYTAKPSSRSGKPNNATLELSNSSPFQSLDLDPEMPILDDQLDGGDSNWVDESDYTSQVSKLSYPPSHLSSITDIHSSVYENNNKPIHVLPNKLKPKKKPLYLRVMEEAARKEAKEHEMKEKAYKQVKAQKSRVNPSQQEIKDHMLWHDNLMHKQNPQSQFLSPPKQHLQKSQRQSASVSPKKKLASKVEVDDSRSQGNSPIRSYLKRKSKRVRFKKRVEVPSSENNESVTTSVVIEVENIKLPSIKTTPEKPIIDDHNHKNHQIHAKIRRSSRKSTPMKQNKSSNSPNRPISAGNDIDLAMFPHGPDWISHLLRPRDNEHKLAEIYEQGFAIMLMEYDAGVVPPV